MVGYGATEDEMLDCYEVAEQLAATVRSQSGRIGSGSRQACSKIENC